MAQGDVTIFYNSKNINQVVDSDGVTVLRTHPVPMVSLSKEMITYGARHAQKGSISLQGQITGEGMSTLLGDVDHLIGKFLNGFKKFEIIEEGETPDALTSIFSVDHCKFESLDLAEGVFDGLVEYTINLSYYDQFESGKNGIINPTETISFSEGEDGVISVTWELSAQGITTTTGGVRTTGLENAKTYVESFGDWDPATKLSPRFVMGLNQGVDIYPLLMSTSETIDRMKETYGLTRQYKLRNLNSDGTTNRGQYVAIDTFSVSIDKAAENDVDTVTVNLTRQSGHNTTMPPQPTAEDLFNEALRRVGDDFGLQNTPLNFSLEENEYNRTLTASATFDNDPRWISTSLTDATQHMGLNVYHDFSVDFSHNDLTDITEVTVSGPLKARGQTVEQKIELLEDWLIRVRADSQNTSADSAVPSVGSGGLPGYLYHEANVIYTKLFGAIFPLNFHPKSFTFSKDTNNAVYNLSATFDNRDVLQSSSVTVDERGVTNEQPHKVNYSVNISPSLAQYRPNASFNQNGWYVIYDIKSNTLERVSIDITSHEQPDIDANVVRGSGYIAATTQGEENAVPRFNYINSVLENLGQKYLTVGSIVETENSSENPRTQTYSLSQKYVNKIPKALSLIEGESYIPVYESRQ
tara:strand:- start:5193 stop:7109 length:1917 start_codon:yes stop_codon:yes gene_type:complete